MNGIQRALAAGAVLAMLGGSCPVLAEDVFHGAYLQGYPDGTVRPEENLTRAELAAVLFRMIPLEERAQICDSESAFLDVAPGHWAYAQISALARLGVVKGDEKGTFRPDEGVTAEELTIILQRICRLSTCVQLFSALAQGWQQQSISFCDGNGWVMGLHDGVFSPETPLTRAEFAEIFNKILGRTPQTLDDLLIGMPIFPDNRDTQAAYFLVVQEAAVDHTAQIKQGRETWRALG